MANKVYDLVKDNVTVQTATFVSRELPVDSERGAWVERTGPVSAFAVATPPAAVPLNSSPAELQAMLDSARQEALANGG